jgi:flagellar basal-body rod protein FlgC
MLRPVSGSPGLPVLRTAARGMEAQRQAVAASTENLANAGTSRGPDGEPFALKRAVLEAQPGDRFARFAQARQTELRATDPRHQADPTRRLGRTADQFGPAAEIVEVEGERMEYDPTHPHADAAGYVHYPDVNVAEEMARLISAQRVYEANLTTVEAVKQMLKRTLEL